MIDVATRTVTAAVLRPTTRAVDASVLLARSADPGADAAGLGTGAAMAHSVLPCDTACSASTSGWSTRPPNR